MSSARGTGSIHGRGRGSTPLAPRGRGRGASTLRGRVFNNGTAQRGGSAIRARAGFAQPVRGSTGRGGRGLNNTRGNAFTPAASPRATFGGAKTGGNWKERYDVLTAKRETERKDAIRQGLVADPDKPRTLSEAITPVGTCQEMCAEFERVERNYQDDVWAEEKGPDGVVDESRMVKKFRRAAAGNEEQLPSDLRSPHVLKRTCDYLFDEIVGNAPSLAKVHHFVWDRTRAIRNDFSIQQLTRLEELRIAVECYERIARFHILSLHQLASPERPYAKYDWPQEREQLDRTLLSLIQYYEDTRDRTSFPNEAEFRAYCVIFQLRSPTPDLEDSVQAWPRSLLRDKRVRKAVDVYAAGCTVMRPQGPLNPKASHLIARQDWQRLWVLLASNEVSYLMGCVAEVYFNSIRQTVLNALFRTFRMNSTTATPDFTLDLLCDLFAFDEEEEVIIYCEYFGFAFKIREDGQQYLDLSSVPGKTLPQPNADMPNQLKSSLVEDKRLGRTLPAVINGMSVRQAQDAGLVIDDEEDEEGMHDVDEGDEQDVDAMTNGQDEEDDEESLFIPEAKPVQPPAAPSLSTGSNAQRKPSSFSWGQPSDTTTSPFSTAAAPAQPANGASQLKFDFLGGGAKSETNGAAAKPTFDFLGGSSKPTEKSAPTPSGLSFLGAGIQAPEKAAESTSPFSFSPSKAASGSTSAAAPKFDFMSGGLGKTAQTAAGDTQAGDQAATAANRPAGNLSQPNGLFSKPSQGQSGPSNPFQFTSPFASNASSPERATATDPGPSKPAPSPATSGPKPAAVESAPNPPPADSQQNPFLQPPPKSPASAQTAPETTPSFPGQTKQVQPHSTAPSSNQPPAFPNSQPSPSPPTLNTGLRRPSTSTDTRPKKPSPLSHSFTAGDDSNSTARDASKESATGKAPARETPQHNTQPSNHQVNGAALTQEGHLTKPVPFKRKPPPEVEQVEAFDDTVTRIAKELVEDPVSGYLKQYVEFKASQYITHVQEEIAAERMKLRLSELRVSTIYRKYFKRWIGLIWQRRFAKSGKNRRERRRKRLEDGFDDGSSHAGDSVGGSRAGSVMETSSWKDHQEQVDAMFQRTINSRSLARPVIGDQQARAGSKRPSSSHGENGMVARASTHKRLKSTSHVDERGRVAKPNVTSNPNDDLLKRSSFLGFSLNGPSPPNKNTTKSNYFRLKAMGVHRADELSAPRGTKRSRTESAQPAPTASPRLRSSVSRASSPEASPTKALMPPPASTTSRAQKMQEEDDALFARMRAARESLTLGTTYMKQEMERDEDFQRSLSASHSSNESPSMMKARADARARASRGATPERDVPAYRLRESKFVPREHYGRAIERSKEMRESRSRETSRPASRPGSSFDHRTAEASAQAPGFSFSTLSNSGDQNSVPNGLPVGSAPAYSSSFNKASTSFSPLKQPNPPTFANHTTEMSNANPFLQSTVPDSMESSKANPFGPFETKTDTSPQHTFGSAPAFGSQSGLGGLPFGSQTQFNSDATGFGFQSGFGSQAAGNHNPTFGSAFGPPSKPTFGSQNTQSPFAAPPQDHTIHPDLVDQSLAMSFGSHGGDDGHHIQPEENSYMPTQAISLLSDDEEVGEASPVIQETQFQANGINAEQNEEELLDEESEEEQTYQPPYGSMNPFALLADQNEEHIEESQSEAEDDEMFDQARFDAQGDRGMDDGFESQDQDDFSEGGDAGFHDGHYGGEEDDEEDVDGDIDEEEDGSADDEDEGEEYGSEDEDEDAEEEEEESQQPQRWAKVEYDDRWTARPEPNPALQKVGNTEDAPIELDSD